MDVHETDGETTTVQLTAKELTILANALNECREAIEAWEFTTRMGADPVEAEQLRAKLRALLGSIRQARP
jgi:hypothetical protein